MDVTRLRYFLVQTLQGNFTRRVLKRCSMVRNATKRISFTNSYIFRLSFILAAEMDSKMSEKNRVILRHGLM